MVRPQRSFSAGIEALRKHRRMWPLLICLPACGWALASFDWPMVGRAFLKFDLRYFLTVGLPVGFFIFLVRGLRWAAVAGMPFTPRILWRTHVQTAIAIATAAATPLQAGEALKIKLAHDATGADYASLSAAFFMERLADMALLFGIGAIGFGLRGASGGALMTAALALAVLVGVAPLILRRLAAAPLPNRMAHAIKPVADYRPAAWRLMVLGLCTTGKWLGVVLLWQATFASCGIWLDFADCAVVVVLVTISITISLIPGGIGVAEVSTRAVLVWLGVEPGLADGGAVMLRLQLPLIIAIGLLHGLALLPAHKMVRHG